LFYKHGFDEQADDCALRAIDSLGRVPGIEPIKIREVLSIFIRGQLKEDSISADGRVNLKRLSDRLSDARFALKRIKEQRQSRKQDAKQMQEADIALSETIMLARDEKRYSRVQLAARFRRFNKYRKNFTWDKPAVAIQLMQEHIEKYPRDVAALNVKSAAHGDLEQWQLGKVSVETALQLEPTNTYSLNTYGRILLGMRLGLEAWAPLEKAYALKPELPTAAMLFISCAVAARQSGLSSLERAEIRNRRAYVAKILRTSEETNSERSFQNLNRIAMQYLILEKCFLEAIVFVREMTEEGRMSNPDYWEQEIDLAITRDGKLFQAVRAEALNWKDDLFPDSTEG
jgi:bifunctional DNA-binding transcriptional regulator/antitoxin component of YhaV-PrlF toxin-antitoxin module